MANDNEKIRKAIAEKTGMPEAKIQCKGCRAEHGQIPFLNMEQPCKVWRCITEKQLHSCTECDEMPCDNLHPYAKLADRRPHNLKIFNLCQIKKLGLTEWAETKASQNRNRYFNGDLEL